MHQNYQNKFILQEEQKSIVNSEILINGKNKTEMFKTTCSIC